MRNWWEEAPVVEAPKAGRNWWEEAPIVTFEGPKPARAYTAGEAAAPEPEARVEPYSGWLLPFSRDAQGNVAFDSDAGILGIAKGAINSLVSGATLPGDVYAGRIDPMSDEAIARSMDLAMAASPASAGARVKHVFTPAKPQIAREADEFGVQLTAGQRTGNPALLSREDAMLGGAYGPRAQEVAQAARARQAQQIGAAQEQIGEVAGRGVAQLERPAEAGGVVADAVRGAATQAREGFKRQYDEAFAGDGVMRPEFFQGAARPGAQALTVPGSPINEFAAPLSQRITERLVNRGEPVIIDDVITPAASRALRELDNVSNLKLGNIGQPGAGDVIEGVTLRGVDQARRKLVAFYKAARNNPADARAVQQIINEFDDQVEQAVTSGLFSGNPKFLDALRGARQAYSSYQKTFKPRGAGDDVGRALQNIVERDATPEQVANYLYGSAKVGNTGLSVRMADRLKEILGESSPEWAAIRQGAWQRLTGVAEGRTPMGAQKMSERILEFVNGDGKTLAQRLFSPEELAQMRRFANVLKATVARPGTTNPPNSGNRLAGLARESLATITSMLGASATGPTGAAAGYAAGRIASTFGDARAASQARQLFAGVEPLSIGQKLRPALAATGRRLALPAGAAALEQWAPR